MVHPEIGNKVPDSHVGPAESVTKIGESAGSNDKTDIRENNVLGMLAVEDGAAGIKVVDTATIAVLLALATALTLTLMEVVAGDVGQEVVGPADDLLAKEVDQGVDGCLLAKLRQLVDHASNTIGLLLAGSGQEDHVTLHVAGGLVVSTVGELPAEVGNEE